MRKKSRFAVLLVLLAACGGSPPKGDEGPKGDETPRPDTTAAVPPQSSDLLAGVQSRTLKNGMKVVVKEDRSLPIVATAVGYRVGSVNESPELTGVSHFLEHMMFKGTDRYKRGEIDRVTFEAGGANNAFTSTDMTVYWFHVASDKLDDFLAIESNRMTKCTMDAMEFEAERKVVLEELNARLDEPWGLLDQEMEKTVFPTSAYHHPVLGWREVLQKLTRDQMADYYRRYYQPNNAILVIVGDVKAEECFAKVAKSFEALPAGTPPPEAKGTEPPQTQERRVEISTEDAAARLSIAYRADVVGSKNDIVLDVISTILSNGKKSRLHARLVEKDELVAEGGVDTSNDVRRYDGVFTVQAELKPGAKPEAAEKAVLEEIERLKTEPVSKPELDRAKNVLRAGFAFDKESTIDLAQSIVHFEVLGLPDYLREYMGRAAAVTADDVRATARSLFDAKRRTVGIARPKKKDKPQEDHGAAPRRLRSVRCARTAPRAIQSAPELGEYWEVRLPNGITLLAKRKAGAPVVALQAFVRGTVLSEAEDKAGLAHLTGELLDEGIRDEAGRRSRNHEEIASTIEDVGGHLTTGASGLAVKVLAEHQDLALDLARDLLRYASFPIERFKKIREDALADIESSDDDPQTVARRLFLEALYPGHPLGRPAIGYRETVEKLTRDDVVRHYRRSFRPDRTIVAVVGEIDPVRVVQDLHRRFADWKADGEAGFPALPPVARQTERREKYEFRRKNQVNVYLGHLGAERSNPDFPALNLMEYILCKGNGFTDRLSIAVREEEGLAYSVGGDITGGAAELPGPFLVYIGTKAEQKDKALETIVGVIQKFVDEGPSTEEVESAKKFLSRNVVFDWEDSASMAGALVEMRRFNLPPDHVQRFVREIRGLTREEVRRVAQKYLDAKNLTLVVVGPVDKEGKVIKVDDK